MDLNFKCKWVLPCLECVLSENATHSSTEAQKMVPQKFLKHFLGNVTTFYEESIRNILMLCAQDLSRLVQIYEEKKLLSWEIEKQLAKQPGVAVKEKY